MDVLKSWPRNRRIATAKEVLRSLTEKLRHLATVRYDWAISCVEFVADDGA